MLPDQLLEILLFSVEPPKRVHFLLQYLMVFSFGGFMVLVDSGNDPADLIKGTEFVLLLLRGCGRVESLQEGLHV
jgi:hypothetical protein